MFSYLKKILLRFKRKQQPAIQNQVVNKGIFHFLGTRIWAPMPVYRYENPSRYVTAKYIELLKQTAPHPINIPLEYIATLQHFLHFKVLDTKTIYHHRHISTAVPSLLSHI